MPAFSTRNCTWPALAARTAWPTLGVTVPSLGFGIRPRGPRIRPSRPTTGIMSGVAMQRSKLISPPWIASARSSAPTTSAPAALASSALSPLANTADPHRLAGAVRQIHRAAHHLVGMARVDAEIERDLDGLVELGRGGLLDQRHRVGERIRLLAVDLRLGGAQPLALASHDVTPPPRCPSSGPSPSIIRTAASRSLAFRSFIFCAAISRTWPTETLPEVARPGVWLPLSSPAAFLRR